MQKSPAIYFIFLYKMVLTNSIIIRITKIKSNIFILHYIHNLKTYLHYIYNKNFNIIILHIYSNII